MSPMTSHRITSSLLGSGAGVRLVGHLLALSQPSGRDRRAFRTIMWLLAASWMLATASATHSNAPGAQAEPTLPPTASRTMTSCEAEPHGGTMPTKNMTYMLSFVIVAITSYILATSMSTSAALGKCRHWMSQTWNRRLRRGRHYILDDNGQQVWDACERNRYNCQVCPECGEEHQEDQECGEDHCQRGQDHDISANMPSMDNIIDDTKDGQFIATPHSEGEPLLIQEKGSGSQDGSVRGNVPSPELPLKGRQKTSEKISTSQPGPEVKYLKAGRSREVWCNQLSLYAMRPTWSPPDELTYYEWRLAVRHWCGKASRAGMPEETQVQIIVEGLGGAARLVVDELPKGCLRHGGAVDGTYAPEELGPLNFLLYHMRNHWENPETKCQSQQQLRNFHAWPKEPKSEVIARWEMECNLVARAGQGLPSWKTLFHMILQAVGAQPKDITIIIDEGNDGFAPTSARQYFSLLDRLYQYANAKDGPRAWKHPGKGSFLGMLRFAIVLSDPDEDRRQTVRVVVPCDEEDGYDCEDEDGYRCHDEDGYGRRRQRPKTSCIKDQYWFTEEHTSIVDADKTAQESETPLRITQPLEAAQRTAHDGNNRNVPPNAIMPIKESCIECSPCGSAESPDADEEWTSQWPYYSYDLGHDMEVAKQMAERETSKGNSTMLKIVTGTHNPIEEDANEPSSKCTKDESLAEDMSTATSHQDMQFYAEGSKAQLPEAAGRAMRDAAQTSDTNNPKNKRPGQLMPDDFGPFGIAEREEDQAAVSLRIQQLCGLCDEDVPQNVCSQMPRHRRPQLLLLHSKMMQPWISKRVAGRHHQRGETRRSQRIVRKLRRFLTNCQKTIKVRRKPAKP